jgi:quinol-cytochrome oxidoreductase complex cytochrome b subunit
MTDNFKKIKSLIIYDTYGAIASAAFLICAVSGIFLAIPYDISAPYESIGEMLIVNPFAVFFRNAHYWSAQLFLIFTLLHLWDHLKQSGEKKVRPGVWLRLVISVLVVFFVMITGFILKADADAFQAGQIMESLIKKIPLVGDLLAFSLLGQGKDLQLVYVHHIATATIFLVVIIIEHSKTIWSKGATFLYTLLIVSVLSFFFQAPLSDNLSRVMKGPWYFVGLQEILHWLSSPGFSLVLVFSILFILYLLPRISEKKSKILKKLILYTFYLYMGLTIVGYFFRGENWEWRTPRDGKRTDYFDPKPILFGQNYFEIPQKGIPTINGRKESCMFCHIDVEGFSPAHNPKAIGCVSCHGGDSFSADKDRAHRNMTFIPGNISDSKRSCGTTNCHPDIAERVDRALMNTLSGMITVDRFVFGESDSLSILNDVHHLGSSAADEHLKNLCVICHLGNPKTETGPITELSRGGGCNACHLNYNEKAMLSHSLYQKNNGTDTANQKIHPSLTLQVTNDHCFGCHSRSGRISTNYEGWHETQLTADDISDSSGFRVLEDERVFTHLSEDVHHKAGLDCIDCHNSYEVMGDGKLYAHEEQQVKIKCEDCHFDKLPETMEFSELDNESKLIFSLKGWDSEGRRFIKGGESGIALVNTFVDDNDSAFMIGKNSGNIFKLNAPSEKCTHNGVHEDMSCSACHTAWAPRCIGCHNVYEPEAEGYDMFVNRFKKGTWVEYTGEYLAMAPTLGVFNDESGRNIKPAVPGMIMTIDRGSYENLEEGEPLMFHRLYAPAEPHTIIKEGRSCKSCHNNPVALGYGEGKLDYLISNHKGRWVFNSKYESNKIDGLPEDAWIPFDFSDNAELYKDIFSHSTRDNFRPFTIEEQKRMLTVGACMNCHKEDSKVMMESLKVDFQEFLQMVTDKCVLPEFEE